MSYQLRRILPSDGESWDNMAALVKSEGIALEKNLTYSVGTYDDAGKLVATGSYFKNTMRCLAVDKDLKEEGFLFNMSIRENIAFGRPDASMAEIRKAAQAAQIDAFIMGLPAQYETLVGERGYKLSGGQRQRISIARTLLLDPPLLILDEPTASVDSVTDEGIITAIANLLKGRTVFMIAHRLWSLRNADRILVLDNGRVVQNGTHEELMGTEGLYKNIFTLQISSETFELSGEKEDK